jgi:ferredoxin-NADP reductase
MEKWLKQYGPVVGLMLGSQPAVAVCGPAEVMEAMRRDEFLGRPENANFRQENFNRKLGNFQVYSFPTEISYK